MTRSRKAPEPAKREPLILWWMPLLALLAPLVLAAWRAATADGDALSDGVVAFFWPGVLLYFGAVAVLWGGWKIELE
jgi:hypothetical protein